MMGKTIKAADLFCGAGGTSTGLARACSELGLGLRLLAINHWDIAIRTHSANHPKADHLCETLDSVDPRKVVQGGKLDLLVASPECTHHSIARGGKPINDQSRASAWHVLRWCEALRIENVLIENVREFQTWGPIGTNGRPLKRRRGETFHAFLNALRSLGYAVDYRILNAADYGDPTSRERLFIIARRGRKPVIWPEPTHTREGRETLFGQSPKWRAAREIIDWSLPGESIFNRKRPLSPNTMARIFAGLKKYCLLPFIVPQQGDERTRSVDRPLQTITTQSRGIGLCQPFLIPNFGERDGQEPRTHSIDDPLPTVTSRGAGNLIQPFIVELRNNQNARSIDEPLSTIATSGAHHALCEPFILGQQSQAAPRSVDNPLPTIATDGAIALVQPFIIGVGGPRGSQEPRGVGEPMRTILTDDHSALVEPFLIRYHGNHEGRNDGDGRTHRVNEPLPTLDTSNRYGLIQPYLIKYNGTGGAHSVDEPLDTLSTKDRFGLVIPALGAVLDIRFRMLQPHELSRAMSFPDDYHFEGNREQRVKQIGNAVPVGVATALCKAILAA